MFLMQKYEERLELARKSERKWQRTLKFKGLCESIQMLQKSKITKRFATFLYYPPFFLQNQYIRRIFAERIYEST